MPALIGNIKNFLFSSDFRYERVVMKGHMTFTVTNTPQTIYHGLGYIPLVKAWTESPTGHVNIATQDPYCDMEVTTALTTTTATFTVFPNQSPYTMVTTKVYYRIYAEGV